MVLTSGDRLGPYEIVAAAGAGGMGEVYKARDTRLDRTVAIKVLPEHTIANPELRARFEREAKAISSLNHPHVCTLYDVGQQNGTDYLVMEYLEGETLAERLKRGALPTGEVLRIGIEMADALDKAHTRGLVHRDLKPGNVMLTRDGAKLLDFGLARLTVPDGVIEGVAGMTRSTPLTGEGTIVGTMQYMPPEQLEGQDADGRSDIFALGTLLYEMVTGKRAFEGKSQASLIAAILEREPPSVSQVQPLAPPGLDRVIRKCLAKDRDARWQSARDLGDELRWIAEGGSQAGIPAPVAARRRFRLRLGWLVAGISTLAAAGLAWAYFGQQARERHVYRFALDPPPGATRVEWPHVSPDGTLLAFHAIDTARTRMIWVRPLNSLDARPLPGTEGAHRFFWSPDSRYVAFFNGDQVKKTAVAGGPPQLVARADHGYDGAWGASGVILFDGNITDSIRQVSAAGGTVTAATTIDRAQGERYHAWPFFLPDGHRFLYVASGSGGTSVPATGEFVLKAGSVDGDVNKVLTRVDSRVEYSPAGYIVYVSEGVLLAQPFDARALEVTGEPVPIAEGVSATGSATQFGVSRDGTLTYLTGAAGGESELIWVDRAGEVLGKIGKPAKYGDLALSPDETRLAYDLPGERGDRSDIWVHDLSRGVTSRLTFDEGGGIWPVWSPDGTRIAYASERDDRYAVVVRQANGLGEPQMVCRKPTAQLGPSDWAQDGRTLLVAQMESGWDIARVDPEDSSSLELLLAAPFNERRGCFSPDGRYFAYQSNESERAQVYVRALGAAAGKWQVSSEGGFNPLWRPDGKEIFYTTDNGDIMAVTVSMEGGRFEVGVPKKLFTRRLSFSDLAQRRWDVTADGQRFILNVPLESAIARNNIVLVQNWVEELKRR